MKTLQPISSLATSRGTASSISSSIRDDQVRCSVIKDDGELPISTAIDPDLNPIPLPRRLPREYVGTFPHAKQSYFVNDQGQYRTSALEFRLLQRRVSTRVQFGIDEFSS